MGRRRWVLRRVLRVAVVAAVAFLLLSVGAGLYMGEASLRVARQPPSTPALPAESVEIKAADGVALRAWLWRPRRPNGDAVLVLHGIGDSRASMDGLAAIFVQRGYLTVAPDSRAHGESGGDLVTYGLREKDDLARWQRWLTDSHGAGCVFALGESMGASVVLQSLGAGARFCAVAAEGAFATFREIAYDRVASGLGRTLFRPLVEAGIWEARRGHGLDLDQADAVAAVAHSATPVLLIHGAADNENPPRHSRMLAAADRHAELWIVPGAGHCGAHATCAAEFESRLLSFFARAPPLPAGW